MDTSEGFPPMTPSLQSSFLCIKMRRIDSIRQSVFCPSLALGTGTNQVGSAGLRQPYLACHHSKGQLVEVEIYFLGHDTPVP